MLGIAKSQRSRRQKTKDRVNKVKKLVLFDWIAIFYNVALAASTTDLWIDSGRRDHVSKSRNYFIIVM